MYAGYGTGRVCDGCREAIGPSDVEYEAHYKDRQPHHFHLGCAALWDAEMRRRHESPSENARRVRQQSQDIREQARAISKHSGQLRDQSDVLARESEAAIDKARQAQR